MNNHEQLGGLAIDQTQQEVMHNGVNCRANEQSIEQARQEHEQAIDQTQEQETIQQTLEQKLEQKRQELNRAWQELDQLKKEIEQQNPEQTLERARQRVKQAWEKSYQADKEFIKAEVRFSWKKSEKFVANRELSEAESELKRLEDEIAHLI